MKLFVQFYGKCIVFLRIFYSVENGSWKIRVFYRILHRMPNGNSPTEFIEKNLDCIEISRTERFYSFTLELYYRRVCNSLVLLALINSFVL